MQSLAVITTRGEILRFSGGGFTQLATLPFFQSKEYSLVGSLSLNASVLSRGMVSEGDSLYIFIANQLFDSNIASSSHLYLKLDPFTLYLDGKLSHIE